MATRKITSFTAPKQTGNPGSTDPKHRLAANEINDFRETIDNHADVIDQITINQPIEVELVTTRTSGMINSASGEFLASPIASNSGFIAVTPGEKIMFTYRSIDFNSTAPATVTGVTGHSAATYGSFVTAEDASGFPKGTIFNIYRFNAENGTTLMGDMDFIDIIKTIPSGVNFINISGASSVPVSVKAVRNTGELKNSLTLLYDKVNSKRVSGSSEGGVGSGNEFTDAHKNKLESIQTPTANYVDKGVGNAIQFFGIDDGLPYLGYVKNGVWVIEGNTKSLKTAFAYPVGYARERDKASPAYDATFKDATIMTAENGYGNPQTDLPSAQNPDGLWNFSEGDAVVAFGIAMGITRFHHAHCTWHTTNEKQYIKDLAINNPGNEKAALLGWVRQHIIYKVRYVKNKFPTAFHTWNVMNESIDNDGTHKKGNEFQRWCTLDEVFETAFTAFREADPDSDGYYNDFNFEQSGGARTDTLLACMATLEAKNITVPGTTRKVKVDGIGSQMHSQPSVGEAGGGATSDAVGTNDFYIRSLKRLANSGAKIMLTELGIKTGTTYDAERLAKIYYNVFKGYERAVPPAQRAGIIMWAPTDRSSYMNEGRSAPGSSQPPLHYPALYDWFGAKKLAYDRILTVGERPEVSADVYQDFIADDNISEITGTYTKGNTPLVWEKAGYTAGGLRIGDLGLYSPQNSQRSITVGTVNYPYVNRTMIVKLNKFVAAGNRVINTLIKYKDTNNYIYVSVNETENVWVLGKVVGGVNTPLITTTISPTFKDEIKTTIIGNVITLFINGNNLGTVVETDVQDGTKAGFRLRGFDDKFTMWESIMIHKI